MRGRSFRALGDPQGRYPVIDGYDLVARVPAGQRANVFLAHQHAAVGMARRVVVKWVSRSLATYEHERALLLDEATVMSYLEHPNVARIAGAGERENGTFLAVDYVEGIDLRHATQRLIARGERMPIELAVHVLCEVLRGLEHVHRASDADGNPLEILHRDVTPSNMLISTSGHVVLADFGIVRMRKREQTPTSPGMVKGKFRYLAPEYVKNQAITQRVDIYSAGVVLFELLTGNLWGQGPSSIDVMRRIVEEGLPLEVLAQAGTPSELCGAVALATDRAPMSRFASAKEMLSALESWMIQRGVYVSASTLAAYVESRGLSR